MIQDYGKDDFINNNQPPIIYGAGKHARYIINGLNKLGCNNFRICDSYKASEMFMSHFVYAPEQIILEDSLYSPIIIGSGMYAKEIYEKIKRMGVPDNQIYTGVELVQLGIENGNTVDLHEIYDHFSYISDIVGFRACLEEGGWCLNHFDIVVTEKCSLNCEECGSLVPLYMQPVHLDEEKVFESFDHLLDTGCFLKAINLIGGEPLMNQYALEKFFQKYKGDYRIGVVQIITNGTIIPNDNLLRNMQEFENTYFIFSDYGNLSKNQQTAIEKVHAANIDAALVSEENIANDEGVQWTSYGEVKLYHYSKEQFQKFYDQCLDRLACNTLLNGKIYLCPRIAHMCNLNLIPNFTNNYVDVSTEIQDKKNFMEQINNVLFSKQYPMACEYCMKGAGKLVPRAKQKAR